ncbi:MAG: hypothetical protein SFV55_23350 [Haliscomenobacter sp.]|uniref:hypothetical protein n=1 Tax=Haliscomenobacter sp. TaxID=2717303 RepID=UPI0029A8E5E2|nr:hypothetical protein [Haliscomenobacter sp.]MDX2071384.1 hypothetical protein [Haliscomenobacter sp.]
MNETSTSKEQLLQAFQEQSIVVLTDNGKFLELENDYSVEIEANGIYKLRSEGLVVAPFASVEELCQFIKMA